MNAYVRVQLLNHTNTCIIPENPITAQLIWVRCSDQNWDRDQFTLRNQVFPQVLDSLESERISCHPYFDLCIRMLPSMRVLDHTNMYSYLGKVQLNRCRDPIFIKELMLKPSLAIPGATWGYHLTNTNITMSVNRDRVARETNHTPIASLTPPSPSLTQPVITLPLSLTRWNRRGGIYRGDGFQERHEVSVSESTERHTWECIMFVHVFKRGTPKLETK